MTNGIKLSKSLLTEFNSEAMKQYPNEACGVIVKIGKKLRLIPCQNISEKPEKSFVIKPIDMSHASDLGQPVAIWHSHVEEPSTPSLTDIEACNMTELFWVISSISKIDGEFQFGEISHIEPSDQEIEYLGRPYIYGVKDCFTLMRDYYKKEFGIDIDYQAPGYPEVDDWSHKGMNLLSDHFENCGFKSLIAEEPKVGDIFLINITSDTPNHVAIYVGEDTILHHCYGRVSCTDRYMHGYYWKHTTFHLRHQSQC